MQADEEYLTGLQMAREAADADSGRKSITQLYHGELAISRLGQQAFDVMLAFLRKLETGDLPGYSKTPMVDLPGLADAKRYAYREVGNYPEAFICAQLREAASDDQVEGLVWLKGAELLVGKWTAKDATRWFALFKALRNAHAAFHSFCAWRSLLRYRIAELGVEQVDWDYKFKKVFKWDPYSEDITTLLRLDSPARDFIMAFKPSKNVKITSRSAEHAQADDIEKAWHTQYTREKEDKMDFFPPALNRCRFMDDPDGGKGKRTAAHVSQNAWSLYSRVLTELTAVEEGEEQTPREPAVRGEAAGGTSLVYHEEDLVIAARPRVHPENALLLGQSDNLHHLSAAEGAYLAPFAKAGRLWLGRQALVFPALGDLCRCLCLSVVAPLARWITAETEARGSSSRSKVSESKSVWHARIARSRSRTRTSALE